MDTARRRQLRDALHNRYPWVTDPVVGPAAVESGECDRCGVEARLVQTCGPGADVYLGRRCAAELGDEAWCSGHVEDARAAQRALDALPPEADTVARLWWVATGEVRLDAGLVHALQRELPAV